MKDTTLLLAPRLFAPVGQYLLVARHRESVVDYSMKADKRFKAAHRYEIVDARGRLNLTVPVCHLSGNRTWDDVDISDHGRWWQLHVTALESAYGRTPFFEFYIDRFLPLLSDPQQSRLTVGRMCRQADSLIRNILELPPALEPAEAAGVAPITDWRRNNFDSTVVSPYWQVRAHTLGFMGGLSILDLIFNLGPESALYIRR